MTGILLARSRSACRQYRRDAAASSVRSRLVLSFLAALLHFLSVAPSKAQDQDSDGIIDGQDNCLAVANPSQLDTNRDGFGNLCDTDYDDNGVSGTTDYGIFKNAYGSTAGTPAYNPNVDSDGNGAIGTSDYGIFRANYGRAPGPSGLVCAGAIPCTCDAPVASVEEVLPWNVKVTWTAAAGSRFEIQRRAAGGAWTTVASPTASQSSYVDSSLTPSSYDYRMRSDCSDGSGSSQWSEYSTAVALELPAECDSQVALGAGLPIPPALPCTGLPEYQAVSALPVPGGVVNVAGGNLLVVREDGSMGTRLGPFSWHGTYSAAWGAWIWDFDLSYHGSVFVDDTLTIHDVSSLANGATIPGTQWVKVDSDTMKTKGGLVYEFGGDGFLAAIHWSSSAYPRIIYARGPDAFQPTLTRLNAIQVRFEGDSGDLLFSMLYDAPHRWVPDNGTSLSVFEYDSSGRLVTVRDNFDFMTEKPGFRYEYSGTLLTAITNSEGERTEYSYDGSRRITQIRQIGGPNPVHTFAYSGPDPVTGLYQTTYTDPLGHATRFRYDHRRRLREVESVDTGELAVREWQGKRITKLVQPDGVTTTWTIANDDVVSQTSASGNVTTIAYEPTGVDRIHPSQRPILRVADSIGLVEQRQYDAQGRLVSDANGESETTSFTYDADQMLASVTDPGGVTTSFSQYGQHGKPAVVSTGGTMSSSFVYDINGDLRWTVSLYAQGGVKERQYDEDRNLSLVELSDGQDGGGRITTTYRSDHRPLTIEREPGFGDHSFVYDALGRLVERREKVDGAWQSTHFEYDAASRMVAIELPNGMRQEVTRDPYGRPLSRRSLRGGVQEATATFSYDHGRITSIYDSVRGGAEQYAYDPAGRIVSILYPNGESLGQGYDLRSRRTFEAYSAPGSGTLRSVGFVWDLADRQTAAFDQGMQILHRSFSGGRLATADFGNGLRRTYTYDLQTGFQSGSVTSRVATGATLEATTIARALLFVGVHGHYQVTATTTTSGGVDQTSTEQYWIGPFTNDPLDGITNLVGKRVTHWSDGTKARDYVYDGFGNLQGTGNDAFSFNAEGNRLVWAYLGEQGQTIGYTNDAAGYATSRGGVPIGWTATGHMSSFGPDSLQWDMSDRLVSTSAGGVVHDFSRFGGRIERDPSTGAFRSLDLGAVSIDVGTGARTYRHLDFRGNVKFTSNDAGVVTSHIRYSAYGVDEVFGSSSDLIQFAGGRVLGPLVLLGARVYDTQVGRFLSPDPQFQLTNQMAYTSGDPVLFSDQSGLTESTGNFRAEAAAKLNSLAYNVGYAGIGLQVLGLILMPFPPIAIVVGGAGVALDLLSLALFQTADQIAKQGGSPPVGGGVTSNVPAAFEFGTGVLGPRDFGPTHHWTDQPIPPHLVGNSDNFGGGSVPACAPTSLTHLPELGRSIWLLISLQLVLAVVLVERRRTRPARR